MKKIILILILIPLNTFAQFDSILFRTDFALRGDKYRTVFPFGDQNDDGFGDFIAYDCFEGKISIFLGGTTIDTIPLLNISSSGQYIFSMAPIDINRDKKLDIVIRDYYDQTVKVFFGGGELDTIPDLIFNIPQGVSNFYGSFMINAGDFNGDGWDDLMLYDPYLPNSNEEIGVDYFFSTYPVFDTIPEMIFHGDTVNKIFKGITSFGDIDGDGFQDFIYRGGGPADSTTFMGLVVGNPEWDTTTIVTFYQNDHQFDVDRIRFIKDVNNDGKDDLMIDSYGNFYPYYYLNSIIYGNVPIDTIPDVGLNTQNVVILDEVSIGDVNGDGYNDFLSLQGFGYPIAKLWLGSNNMNNNNLPIRIWGNSPDFFGGMINRVGDVDGDGVNDFALGTATMTGTCRDGFFIIVKGDTSVKVASVKDDIDVQPEGFELLEPYPNPFNNSTIISWQFTVPGKVSLKVYGILGNEVAVLVNEEKLPGIYFVEFNADEYHLSSGIYFYTLTSGNFTATKKFILLK